MSWLLAGCLAWAAVPHQADAPTSPLHTYLGIDTETGEFRDPADAPALRNASGEKPHAENANGGNANGGNASGENVNGETAVGVDDFREALQKLAAGEGELAGLLSGSDAGSLTGMMRTVGVASILVMLVYPLGIVLVELFGGTDLREDATLTAEDRRHLRRRRRRRLLLAGCWAAAITLLAAGQYAGYWWREPAKLSALAAAVAVCLLAAGTLTGLIRRADADYPAALLRAVRTRQDELAAEVADLRRRVGRAS